MINIFQRLILVLMGAKTENLLRGGCAMLFSVFAWNWKPECKATVMSDLYTATVISAFLVGSIVCLLSLK